jgi:hypothetical protein
LQAPGALALLDRLHRRLSEATPLFKVEQQRTVLVWVKAVVEWEKAKVMVSTGTCECCDALEKTSD